MNYVNVLETLEKPWSKPYNGIKWTIYKDNSSNLSKILFAYQPHAEFFINQHIFSAYHFILTIFLFKF